MYDTHFVQSVREIWSHYALTTHVKRVGIKRNIRICTFLHLEYTSASLSYRCHLFSFLCCFSSQAYLELWEMLRHSLRDRKPSQTSNILVSFKLSTYLLVSCSIPRAHEHFNNASTDDTFLLGFLHSSIFCSGLMVIAVHINYKCIGNKPANFSLISLL